MAMRMQASSSRAHHTAIGRAPAAARRGVCDSSAVVARAAVPPGRRTQRGLPGSRRSDASATAAAAVEELLAAAAGTERGNATSADARARIMAAVETLKAAGAGTRTVDACSATWKLVWTTEKESLWILKNAGLFRTKAGGVYQVIDAAAGRLQNVITFPPEGAFIVDSSLSPEGPQRFGFKFTAAKLKLPGRDIGVPPFGQGWFDTVYVDERIRVAQDVRGDTLVVERDGPPRIFT